MYHSISDEDESGVHPYYQTTTSPAAFAAQMEYLYLHGFKACSPTQAVESLQSSATPKGKQVVITFDDGYGDFYREAFPVLNRFRFSATVYLPTAYIGDGPTKFKGRDCLTWPQVRELQRCGISFGSHTVSHPQLHDLGKQAVEAEIGQSKKTIEEKTGSPVDSFAYPYAFPQVDVEFKKMLRQVLEDAEYHNGVCTTIGRATPASDSLFLERLPMNGCDDTTLLQAKLAGAYDWVARTQTAVKWARAASEKLSSHTQFG
jgi:peptidoglycan/xylan/chitin deacetylase (PgdA/CDA1 family)